MATDNRLKTTVYLTGFMGCGKSYTGNLLADRLGLPFTDLDAEIERAAGKTINDIFDQDGEAAFRVLEAETLRATGRDTATVVATGGGAPCHHDGMNWMNDHGITVFLDPPLEVLLARLEEGRDHRPLLQSGAVLRSIVTEKLSARRPVYEQARIQLTIEDPNMDLTDLLVNIITDGGIP